jgi:hypothetical protein
MLRPSFPLKVPQGASAFRLGEFSRDNCGEETILIHQRLNAVITAPTGNAASGHDGDWTASKIAATRANNTRTCCSAFVAANAPQCPRAPVPCAMIVSVPAASAVLDSTNARIPGIEARL